MFAKPHQTSHIPDIAEEEGVGGGGEGGGEGTPPETRRGSGAVYVNRLRELTGRGSREGDGGLGRRGRG